jgi:hypothetical protein
MVDLSVDATVPTVLKSRRRSIFGRIGDWLFSQRHFHLKLLSGTTVGVIVIIFLAGVFLLVTLRNHYQDTLRTHTIEVIRLSSLIENDIASLESGHRVIAKPYEAAELGKIVYDVIESSHINIVDYPTEAAG